MKYILEKIQTLQLEQQSNYEKNVYDIDKRINLMEKKLNENIGLELRNYIETDLEKLKNQKQRIRNIYESFMNSLNELSDFIENE